MLSAIMDNLGTESGRKELWKNSSADDVDNLQDLNLNINLKTGDIKIKSKTMEPDGEAPLFEWDLNANTGHIEEITRTKNKERIVERDVNPDTLKISDDFFHIELPKTDVTKVQSKTQEKDSKAEVAPTAAVTKKVVE